MNNAIIVTLTNQPNENLNKFILNFEYNNNKQINTELEYIFPIQRI